MAQMLLMNPRRRRRRTTAKKRPATRRRRTTARRANPVKRRVSRKVRSVSTRRRRYKRNPIKGGLKGISSQFIDAVTGAGGAIGLDLAMGYIPLPAALSTGMARHATKGAMAVGLGLLASSFLPKAAAAKMANGALTVVLHDAMREQLTVMAPSLTLGDSAVPYYPDMPAPELGYYNPGELAMGEYVDPVMGEYVENYDNF